MTKRIFQSICGTVGIVVLITVLLVSGGVYSYFLEMQQQQLRTTTDLLAQRITDDGTEFLKHMDTAEYRITYIDQTGTVLFDSNRDSTQMENHLGREEIQQALAEGQGETVRYSATLMEKSLYSAKRLNDGTVLRLSVTVHSILKVMTGFAGPFILLIVITLLLVFLLARKLTERIVEPLNRMDLEEPLNNREYDELLPMLERMDAQQKELKKAEQRRREFTANVSHELKTPLQSISGYSELMKCGMVKEQDIPGFSEKIYQEAKRLSSLVDEIMNLSKLEEPAVNHAMEEINLLEEAAKVVDSLRQIALAHGIEIHLTGEPTMISGNRELIHGICYNLCDNAIKYNRPGGTVTVEVADCSLTVKDTGIGISKEHLDYIFERFYRVDKGRSREVGGTGLGLAIVKHAAMIHNAEIEVESEVQKGTRITVRFSRDN